MIRVENLNVRLLEFRLKDVNLALQENEFFMLMGPTGAGKTVLLEAVAGLIQVDGGKIFIGERDVTRLPSEKRGIGIVYQDQALFPHFNVLENITYGLRFHHVRGEERKKRLRALTELLAIDHLLSRLPVNLSGGEKQRVALARALIVKPDVLLLDEPLSAIDPVFREEIRKALKDLHTNSGTTFLMVTHDFGEALALADRGAVIHQGLIEQVDPVHDLFQKPTSPAVAEFVGMKNLFEADFQNRTAIIENHKIAMSRIPDPQHSYIAIRPEEIAIGIKSFPPNRENTFHALITAISDRGFTYEVHTKAGTCKFVSVVTRKDLFDSGLTEGLEVFISFDPGSVHTL
ncbi:MAG TPA: ABC transporter ATP-binding protein [Desulfobacteraceae bacterium]|nr:ABC transporter ATP-binding protein [Desulfobacteraceae bacterium]